MVQCTFRNPSSRFPGNVTGRTEKGGTVSGHPLAENRIFPPEGAGHIMGSRDIHRSEGNGKR
ncbi:hypothetical protein QFZ75_001067 [Streptomyces sp. V3I8]|jgi:hypothetical protein|nr:hypothetical protein [Streptomyces sp. V3I8]